MKDKLKSDKSFKIEDLFVKKGPSSNRPILIRDDIVRKVKAIMGKDPVGKAGLSDVFNNIIDRFFDTHKQEMSEFLERSKKNEMDLLG